eukprot:439850-Prymnesium_polylepis.2
MTDDCATSNKTSAGAQVAPASSKWSAARLPRACRALAPRVKCAHEVRRKLVPRSVRIVCASTTVRPSQSHAQAPSCRRKPQHSHHRPALGGRPGISCGSATGWMLVTRLLWLRAAKRSAEHDQYSQMTHIQMAYAVESRSR